MTKSNMDKKKEEYMQIVRNNWHYGAGEIIDMDKFIDETLSWISTNFVPKEEIIQKIEGMKYKNKHHHDFQLTGGREGFPDDNKYYCLACRLPLTDFEIPKDKYKEKWCPHYGSYNKAINDILKELQDK